VCPTIALDAAADSHVGRRRQNNEDSFAALPELGLFMVADGLGGKPAGEVASRLAINAVRASMEEDDMEDTWPPGFVCWEHRDGARLALSVQRANRYIFDTSRYQPQTRGMATTFAGLLVSPAGAFVAHVGDSRVYRFRSDTLEQLTRDHTVFEALLEDAEHELEDFGALGNSLHAVTRALGRHETVEVDTRIERAEPGDVFLVCSDGLWGTVPEAEIIAVLGTTRDLRAATALLIDRANERGGPDNVTCVLARVGGQ
jgi:serine/threonine protein phosphatase PrpC